MTKNLILRRAELAFTLPGAVIGFIVYLFGLLWLHARRDATTIKERRLREWCLSAFPLFTGIFWSILFVLAFTYFVTIPRGELFRQILK